LLKGPIVLPNHFSAVHETAENFFKKTACEKFHDAAISRLAFPAVCRESCYF